MKHHRKLCVKIVMPTFLYTHASMLTTLGNVTKNESSKGTRGIWGHVQ